MLTDWLALLVAGRWRWRWRRPARGALGDAAGAAAGQRVGPDRRRGVLDGLLALARAERPVADRAVVELDEVLADRLDAWRVLAEHEGLRLARSDPTGLRALVPAGTVEAVLLSG